jgi:putative phosphoesterase
MRIGVLSDIHGNSRALKSVLSNAEKKGVTRIYDLGDSLYGPLEPMITFEILRQNNILSISGNQDRLITEPGKQAGNPTLDYVMGQLDEKAMNWLSELPDNRSILKNIFACHGTPQTNNEYLTESITNDHLVVKDFSLILESLQSLKETIFICGHSHIPRVIHISGKTIINPGSVGLPAYSDETPVFHKVENLNPNANYCILDISSALTIEQISVPYPFEEAAKTADKNNRKDWAKWIRTGRI